MPKRETFPASRRLIRQLKRRNLFANKTSWATDSYVRLLNWLPRAPLPFRRYDFPIRPRGLRAPILVRANTADLGGATEIFEWGIYGDVVGMVSQGARAILDLGGNIGLSVRFWQEYFPQASILVVEPDAGNLAQLRKNVCLGPRPERVTAVWGFAAAEPGYAAVDRSGDEVRFRMANRAVPGVEAVPKRTVADLFSTLAGAGGRVDLLKCDIEGAEAEVFRTCGAWISRVNAMVVETHSPYTPEALISDLTVAGSCIGSQNIFPSGEGMFLVWIRFVSAGSSGEAAAG